jgi:hypothetical protein
MRERAEIVLTHGGAQSRPTGWRRHRPSIDQILVVVALLGIVIALVVAMWPGD